MAKKKNNINEGAIKKKRDPSLIAAVLLLSYFIGFFIFSSASAARSNTTVKPSASTINVSNNDKRQESLSEDCIAKREIVLKRASRGHSSSLQDHRSSSTAHHNIHQKLKPKLNSDVNLDNGSEHIPRCTNDGKFEPIQCLLDYCWCVNKYGQAVKNSARTNETPICDTKLYESESDDHLVITGFGAARMKNFLKPSVLKDPNDKDDGDDSTDHNSRDHHDGRIQPRDSDKSESNRRLESSAESDLALVPSECTLSRENARARKLKHHDPDSVWIPDCDATNGRLYAERQCHKSRVCWCVNQGTGLPLRSSEQLTKGPGINCTEVRRIIEIASMKTKQESHNKVKPSFFHGFSESCDAERRSEFVQNLIGQFRQQLIDHLKLNPSLSSHSNPYSMSEEQVALWEFDFLDMDDDGKLDEREWSKFKMNFKLVEKLDNNPQKLTETMSPLFILRSQRKCWRDFLEFCGDGDVLDYSLVNQSKWLSCTELPAVFAILSTSNERSRFGLNQNPGGIPDAYTKAAAEARRKSKNPFLGILKPD